jgi:hypothetical protein
MGYKTECDRCEDTAEEPMLMGQLHEDEYMTSDVGDILKDADYNLADTITFCKDCTLDLLTDAR